MYQRIQKLFSHTVRLKDQSVSEKTMEKLVKLVDVSSDGKDNRILEVKCCLASVPGL